MADFTQRREALVKRILEGAGKAPSSDRRSAFDNRGLTGPAASLVDKVAKNAWKVTGADIDAARTAGQSEDQLFELIVCAAVGQAGRQYDAALAALNAAAGKT